MDPAKGTVRPPGTPKSDADAAFLERFEARMRLPIIVSAILPLVVVPQSHGWVGDVVGILTWLVFLVDYVVHVRYVERYRRTGAGRFDLFVVVATAPWFLLPGASAGRFVVLLRLARLARVLRASRGSRRLLQRLSRVLVVAGGVVVIGSLVAYYAEHPTNQEFATVGDALWWGIVTLTTVGYGDIVPKTPTGRWAAVTIMVTGIAVLGVLSGSLASFFRLDSDQDGEPNDEEGAPRSAPPAGLAAARGDQTGGAGGSSLEEMISRLTAEVFALRQQVDTLVGRLRDENDRPEGT
jgi:voltage-gated potassium channel